MSRQSQLDNWNRAFVEVLKTPIQSVLDLESQILRTPPVQSFHVQDQHLAITIYGLSSALPLHAVLKSAPEP